MIQLTLILLLALVTSNKVEAQIFDNTQLLLAVAEVESHFNPNAIGSKGERGMWQLMPKAHPKAPLNGAIGAQMRYVDAYLTQLKRECSPRLKEAWIVCYNYGPKNGKKLAFPKKTAYYRKIQEALKHNDNAQKYVYHFRSPLSD